MLNKGKRRLEPVSWSETDEVGQFSRLDRDSAWVVDGDVELVVLAVGPDELQAAVRRATPPSTIRARTPR
jgi:hypothetical protein